MVCLTGEARHLRRTKTKAKPTIANNSEKKISSNSTKAFGSGCCFGCHADDIAGESLVGAVGDAIDVCWINDSLDGRSFAEKCDGHRHPTVPLGVNHVHRFPA